MIEYINKKGQPVSVEVTHHAFQRFQERWTHVFKGQPPPADWNLELEWQFGMACRVKNLNFEEKRRLERYGADTIYFRSQNFQFVVQDASLMTVELHSDLRPLNKVSPARPETPKAETKYRLSILIGLQNFNMGFFRSSKPEKEILEDSGYLELAIYRLKGKHPELDPKNISAVKIIRMDGKLERYVGELNIT